MLIVLSPAKKMNFEVRPAGVDSQPPKFMSKTKALVKELQTLDPVDLQDLMHLSVKLADLNYHRYQHFHDPISEKEAILAFSGDVYSYMRAGDFSADELAFASEHIRILSGLYGVLQPTDTIYPHRLEMGTHLVTSKGNNLYDFWGDKITKHLNQTIAEKGYSVLVNLASEEYFKAIRAKSLSVPVLTIQFKQWKGDYAKSVGLLAKRGRGMMARFIVENRIREPEQLKTFAEEDYAYSRDLSDANVWVFVR